MSSRFAVIQIGVLQSQFQIVVYVERVDFRLHITRVVDGATLQELVLFFTSISHTYSGHVYVPLTYTCWIENEKCIQCLMCARLSVGLKNDLNNPIFSMFNVFSALILCSTYSPTPFSLCVSQSLSSAHYLDAHRLATSQFTIDSHRFALFCSICLS